MAEVFKELPGTERKFHSQHVHARPILLVAARVSLRNATLGHAIALFKAHQ